MKSVKSFFDDCINLMIFLCLYIGGYTRRGYSSWSDEDEKQLNDALSDASGSPEVST